MIELAKDAAIDTASSNARPVASASNVSRIRACRTRVFVLVLFHDRLADPGPGTPVYATQRIPGSVFPERDKFLRVAHGLGQGDSAWLETPGPGHLHKVGADIVSAG